MHLCLAAIAYLNRSENMNSKIGIDMDSLWELGRDLTEVRSALRYYQDKHVLLLFDGKEIETLFLQQFLEHVLSLQKEKLKKCQRQGINMALQRKYEGTGTYGRPKTILPDGFNERIEDCVKKNHPLSDYCDEIEMKKSTFYKYAKRVQERMKIEEKDKK